MADVQLYLFEAGANKEEASRIASSTATSM